MKLTEFFVMTELTPFSQQTTMQTNTMGQSRIDSSQGGKGDLKKIEDALHKVLVAETGGPSLARIINKFLVDIAPYMEGP